MTLILLRRSNGTTFCARGVLVEYWLKQGVRIELPNDPTKALRTVVGPNGLPRGYAGEDAIKLP